MRSTAPTQEIPVLEVKECHFLPVPKALATKKAELLKCPVLLENGLRLFQTLVPMFVDCLFSRH